MSLIIVLLVGYLAYRRLVRRIEWQAQIATEQLAQYCAFMEKKK